MSKICDWFRRWNWATVATGGGWGIPGGSRGQAMPPGTRTVLGTDGPRAAHLLVSPQSNSVHQPVREPTEPTDASACGAYESSDRRQRFPSAFRRTVASESCSIRASISLSKARGIVSENSTRRSAFVPDIRTRRGSISSRQMTSVEAFISSSRSGCGVPF